MDENEVRRIAREESRVVVAMHEIRFTLVGLGVGVCGVLGWLVGTGMF